MLERVGRSGCLRYPTNKTAKLNENGIDFEVISADRCSGGILHACCKIAAGVGVIFILLFFSFGSSRNRLKSAVLLRSRVLIKEERKKSQSLNLSCYCIATFPA